MNGIQADGGEPQHIVVRCLKHSVIYSIRQVHVTVEYPINYNPLYFTDYGKICLVGVKKFFGASGSPELLLGGDIFAEFNFQPSIKSV